jgi:hypothetical protein
MQNTIPSTKTALKSLPLKQQARAMLDQNKDSIAKVLPRHLSAERLLRVAQTTCTTTPALLKSQRLDTVLEWEDTPSFGDEDDADIEQTPVATPISKPKINPRKETAAPASKPSNGQGINSSEPSAAGE